MVLIMIIIRNRIVFSGLLGDAPVCAGAHIKIAYGTLKAGLG